LRRLLSETLRVFTAPRIFRHALRPSSPDRRGTLAGKNSPLYAIVDSVSTFAGDRPPSNDLTLMVPRRLPMWTPVSLTQDVSFPQPPTTLF